MKIILSTLIVIAATKSVFSQNIQPSSRSENQAIIMTIHPRDENPQSERQTFLNAINIRAVRDFVKRHEDITNVKWYEMDSEFLASFTKDSIKTHVFYTKKGDFLTTIKYYYENRLPGSVRHIIRSNYYDYSIFHITEVHVNNQVAYVVKIQDDKYLKVIKVVNDEMEMIEIIEKS